MDRGLRWVVAGVVVLAVLVVAIAPELVGDLAAFGGTIGVAAAAVLPAVVVAAIFVGVRRRRRTSPGQPHATPLPDREHDHDPGA